ncbi:MAG TPA: hypothetical protein DD658_02845 [Deltaproteobacteria bacterium]|nr:hypothetical protein [Deltaproteobacteria bacterium]
MNPRTPEFDLALYCEGTGVRPEIFLEQLDGRSEPVTVEGFASAAPGLDRDRALTVLSILNRAGAIRQKSAGTGTLNDREWEVVPAALEMLLRSAKSIYDAMPLMRGLAASPMSFRIAATIPDGLQELERFFTVFDSTHNGLRSLIRDSRRELFVMVPFMDDEGFGVLLPMFEDAIKRGVVVRFLSRKMARGQRNRGVLGNLIDACGGCGDLLSLYEARIEEDVPVSHAKVLSRDGGEEVYVGSANFTGSSMERTVEIGVFLRGPGTGQAHEFLAAVMARSVKIWP